jgi:DNA-directed RNA polymerase subunit beta
MIWLDRELREDIKDPKTGEVIATSGERITEALAKKIAKLGLDVILVTPFVSDMYEYLSADAEDKFVIAQANAPLNEYMEFDTAGFLSVPLWLQVFFF